jgi:hypothetical protein
MVAWETMVFYMVFMSPLKKDWRDWSHRYSFSARGRQVNKDLASEQLMLASCQFGGEIRGGLSYYSDPVRTSSRGKKNHKKSS